MLEPGRLRNVALLSLLALSCGARSELYLPATDAAVDEGPAPVREPPGCAWQTDPMQSLLQVSEEELSAHNFRLSNAIVTARSLVVLWSAPTSHGGRLHVSRQARAVGFDGRPIAPTQVLHEENFTSPLLLNPDRERELVWSPARGLAAAFSARENECVFVYLGDDARPRSAVRRFTVRERCEDFVALDDGFRLFDGTPSDSLVPGRRAHAIELDADGAVRSERQSTALPVYSRATFADGSSVEERFSSQATEMGPYPAHVLQAVDPTGRDVGAPARIAGEGQNVGARYVAVGDGLIAHWYFRPYAEMGPARVNLVRVSRAGSVEGAQELTLPDRAGFAFTGYYALDADRERVIVAWLLRSTRDARERRVVAQVYEHSGARVGDVFEVVTVLDGLDPQFGVRFTPVNALIYGFGRLGGDSDGFVVPLRCRRGP